MIKAVYIEDEPANVKLLEALLSRYCKETIDFCGSASTIVEALVLIEKIKPQLIFLDIELKDGNAFDLLDLIKTFDFYVIFITAYSDFAVKAFRHNAIDYLLKPIEIDNLKEAVQRASDRINNENINDINSETIKFIKENIGIKKIGIPVQDGLVFINTDDIVHCEAKGNYSVITFIDKTTIVTAKNLKDLETFLPGSFFLRVHHSWIVNIRYLKKYYRGKNSYMEMDDGSTVSVSIRKKGDFLDNFLKTK
ncbi:MAG: LytTR family DNA-binding domain-containing protein [Ferruginibacter sp.]